MSVKKARHLYAVPDMDAFDWRRISYLLHASRAMDEIEETELVPAKMVFNQFSARGHDFAQILIGSLLTHPYDAVAGYYRSRPLVLSLGLCMEDAVAAPMAKAGGYSDGRDIGVVCNYPNADHTGAMLFPMAGGVGAQYTPSVGWAQAIDYRVNSMKEDKYQGAISVTMGGDSSMSTNGFWSALNIATTNNLPQLFVIEDNGYGISVPQEVQTPGGDQVENLKAYKNLHIIDVDGTDPDITPRAALEAVRHVRSGKGACLIRFKVPRLCGHTFQDTQAYKPQELIESEKRMDPLPKLHAYLVDNGIVSEEELTTLEQKARDEVRAAVESAKLRPEPETANIRKYTFAERDAEGNFEMQLRGGLHPDNHQFPASSNEPNPDGKRQNMMAAIRMTLDYELSTNPKMMAFGEDVGPKGGVHAATLGLNEKYGNDRVFDTSLSEEGIIGRSVGMALNGLLPVPEIQFRKYAEPAAEQIVDTGIMRWRTNNQFAAPMVVRIPGGFAGRGDPWHSMSDEVEWAHKTGWQIAMPSNAEDAVGLLRYALRDNNPTIFFEHRALIDAASARRPYPGDEYILPFGKANVIQEGTGITVVTWGAMVERCLAASEGNTEVEVIDLRTIQPWDKETVLSSVQKTGRCIIVHEDNMTAGFGAEIAATLAREAFFDLDAPIERMAMPDTPVPHNINLLQAVLPSVDAIKGQIQDTLEI